MITSRWEPTLKLCNVTEKICKIQRDHKERENDYKGTQNDEKQIEFKSSKRLQDRLWGGVSHVSSSNTAVVCLDIC